MHILREFSNQVPGFNTQGNMYKKNKDGQTLERFITVRLKFRSYKAPGGQHWSPRGEEVAV